MNYLRLIRWSNLLLLVLTQASVWFCLPLSLVIGDEGTSIHRGFNDFLLICTATLLITAAGYIINDIADVEIDKINKPQKQLVGGKISYTFAWTLYLLLNIIALAIGFLLTNYLFLWIFILSIGLLWVYSYYFKKMLLIGNVVVAGLSALAVGELFFLDLQFLPSDFQPSVAKTIFIYKSYIAFAFLSTLLREIVKDIEDREGDAKAGAKTLPIHAGLKITKIVVSAPLLALLFVLIMLFQQLYDTGTPIVLFYIPTILMLPLVLIFILIIMAGEKKHFSSLSFIIKLYMLAGLLLLWLYCL